MEPKQVKNLTLKQRLWLKYYIEIGNATEAARLAGYQCNNEQSFRQIGYENLTKLDTSSLLEEIGVTKVALVKILIVGLTKPVKHILKRVVKAREDGSKVQIVEHVEVPDYEVRHRYLLLALKMHGLI